MVAQGQDFEDVALDVGLARHEGAPEPELVGRGDDAAQGVRRADDDCRPGVLGPEAAAVIRGEGRLTTAGWASTRPRFRALGAL
jgi:hypothetical protein